jgi:uncharacterized protein (DUF697 family)
MASQTQISNARKVVESAGIKSAVVCGAAVLPWTECGPLILIRKGMIEDIFRSLGRYCSDSEIDDVYDGIIDKAKNYRTGERIASTLLKFIPFAGSVAGSTVGGVADVEITEHMGHAIINALSSQPTSIGTENLIHQIRSKL